MEGGGEPAQIQSLGPLVYSQKGQRRLKTKLNYKERKRQLQKVNQSS